jgi:hypothetical protein
VKYGPTARAVLEALLDKYQDEGVITRHGAVGGIPREQPHAPATTFHELCLTDASRPCLVTRLFDPCRQNGKESVVGVCIPIPRATSATKSLQL